MGNRKCLGSIKPLFTTADLDFCQFPSKEQKKESYRTSRYSLPFFFFARESFIFRIIEMGLKDTGIPGNKKGETNCGANT